MHAQHSSYYLRTLKHSMENISGNKRKAEGYTYCGKTYESYEALIEFRKEQLRQTLEGSEHEHHGPNDNMFDQLNHMEAIQANQVNESEKSLKLVIIRVSKKLPTPPPKKRRQLRPPITGPPVPTWDLRFQQLQDFKKKTGVRTFHIAMPVSHCDR